MNLLPKQHHLALHANRSFPNNKKFNWFYYDLVYIWTQHRKKKKNQEITLAYEDFILIIHNSIIWNTMLLLYDERRKDEICISNKHFYPNCYFSKGTVFNVLQNIDEIIPQFLFSYLQQDKFQLIGIAGMHRGSHFF